MRFPFKLSANPPFWLLYRLLRLVGRFRPHTGRQHLNGINYTIKLRLNPMKQIKRNHNRKPHLLNKSQPLLQNLIPPSLAHALS